MAETSDAIKAHIDHERARLEMRVHEVERRASTHWRHWRRRLPRILIGAGAVLGLILGLRARA
ncbi:MAG: hypothetical protein IT158_24890 [Bryobacterales bacterium]|nr:hypothetical protein [Bryobacterales bacterium]